MKIYTRTVILVILALLICIPASAHSVLQEGVLEKGYIGENYQEYFIGGESIGWAVMEDRHSGSKTIEFRFAGLTREKIYYIFDGAQSWDNIAYFFEASDSASIIEMDNYGPGFVARVGVYNTDIDSNGHVLKWTMQINTYYDTAEDGQFAFDEVTAAHELGHIIGLTDLYTTQNYNKVMCGYEDMRTATSPTSSDFWGAKVILGTHTTHTFSKHQYWGKNSNGEYFHESYCSDCNGKKATRTKCRYAPLDSYRTCMYCGHSPYLM